MTLFEWLSKMVNGSFRSQPVCQQYCHLLWSYSIWSVYLCLESLVKDQFRTKFLNFSGLCGWATCIWVIKLHFHLVLMVGFRAIMLLFTGKSQSNEVLKNVSVNFISVYCIFLVYECNRQDISGNQWQQHQQSSKTCRLNWQILWLIFNDEAEFCHGSCTKEGK